MKTMNKMFGILAVLVAAVAVSTYALPSLAAPIMDQLKTRDQLRACDQLITEDQLQTQSQLRTCIEDCTQLQTMEQTRARDGSCGDCVSDGDANPEATRDQLRTRVMDCGCDCSQVQDRLQDSVMKQDRDMVSRVVDTLKTQKMDQLRTRSC